MVDLSYVKPKNKLRRDQYNIELKKTHYTKNERI